MKKGWAVWNQRREHSASKEKREEQISFVVFLKAKRGGWSSFICEREGTVRFWKSEVGGPAILRGEKERKGVTIFCGGGGKKEEGELISLLSLLRFERKIIFFVS